MYLILQEIKIKFDCTQIDPDENGNRQKIQRTENINCKKLH